MLENLDCIYNETSNSLHVFNNTETTQLIIYDLLGKKIFDHDLKDREYYIPLNDFEKGVYYISFYSNDILRKKSKILIR